MNHIVVGLGFGDEGKGTTTNWLCKQSKNPIVIRFSGGHQAGHTIEKRDGTRHVFQSFGSGTLEGHPTFWSKYCVMFPIGFQREYNDLIKLKVKPVIYFDPEVAVTTIYDVLYNQALEKARDTYLGEKGLYSNNRHGSVGVGIGCTYERQETPYKLYFKDLYSPTILRYKLDQIRSYYNKKLKCGYNIDYIYSLNNFKEAEENFQNCVNQIVNNPDVKMMSEQKLFNTLYSDYIFEGSQGILLDKDHGFFPNVTRCSVTSKNAIEMIERASKDITGNFREQTQIHYVTRCYATRHGAGIFPTEGKTEHLIDGLNDRTNFNNDWQQDFRYGCLDLELIDYALETDNIYSEGINKVIHMTCLDHLKKDDDILCRSILDNYKYWNLETFEYGFKNRKISNIYTSNNPYSEFKQF